MWTEDKNKESLLGRRKRWREKRRWSEKWEEGGKKENFTRGERLNGINGIRRCRTK